MRSIGRRMQLWPSLVVLFVAAVLVVQAVVHPIPSDTSNLQCSNQFILYNLNCYRYFGSTSKRAYFHAQKQCHRHQSSLVTIHSHKEEQFIISLAETNTSFWIGLNDHDGPGTGHREGVFKWGAGGTIEYFNWRIGEPENKQHLDCVKADHEGWAMASGGCASTKLSFVCKRIACPQGLDLDDGVCDVILTKEPTEILASWRTYHILFLLIPFLFIIITCTVTCRLRSHRYATTSNCVPVLEKTRLRTSLTVQDIYPT